jgi:glycosyltransferase involved in cell wall biosynthesis
MITVNVMSYKYGHLVAHCVESLLSQTLTPIIKAYDDGVGDCKHLSDLYPEIEVIERKENFGIVKNFQDALMRTETDRVMFLGADNWLRSDALEILNNHNADILTYDIIVTGYDKNEILKRHPSEVKKYHGDWYWDRSSGHHGSMLYNTNLAKKVGGYERSGGLRSEEDMVLYIKMINAGAKRIHVPEGLLYYRRHRENFNQ